jgi:hypothetical protein
MMDIETFNKIQSFLEKLGFNSDEFILEALERELERRKTNEVLNVVLDEFKRSANERIEYDFYDEKVCTVTVDNNGLISVPPLTSWNRESLNLTSSYQNDNRKIIIILESPHTDEFKENKFQGAACGETGNKISKHLSEVLPEIYNKQSISWNNASCNYDLLLVNAIQSQCSLGVTTEYFRDLMFIGLWFKDGKKENFKLRLRNLNLTANDIVINACTGYGHSGFKYIYTGKKFGKEFLKPFFNDNSIKFTSSSIKGMRLLVHEAILDIYNSFSFVYQRMSHPSSWYRTGKNGLLEPIYYAN